jgi:hypothetical protein
VDGGRHPVGSTRQGQFAAFDPEPAEDDDEPPDGEDEGDDGDDGDEDEDSVDLPGDVLPDVPVLAALSLALAAFRLSVR